MRRAPAAALTGPRLTTLLVLLGVALRAWAYLADTSLWLDEILLARNIIALPPGELVGRPLYLDQVAPAGFLLLEKLAVTVLGPGERALRLFPFLCAVGGLLLFRRLAERTLDGPAVPSAVALGAIAIPFIRYASEVKQYEVDAAAAVLLLLLAVELREREPSTRALLLAGVAGLAIAALSQAAVLVMAGIGLAFLVQWLLRRDRASARVLLVTMPVWAVAAGGATALGMRAMTRSTREFMHQFWRQGFLPWPPSWPGTPEWLWAQLQSVFTEPALLRYPWPPLYLAISVVGIAALWRQRRQVALLLLGPFTAALAAAAAGQYPFRGRLILFLVPGLLLAIAAGLEWLRQALGRLHPAAGWAAMLGLLALPVAALVQLRPPYDIEHHRTTLAYLARHRRPGDAMHVFPLQRIGVLFYGARFGLQSGEWTTAVCDRHDTRAYLRDVDRYRGRSRLWLLSARPRAFRVASPAVRQYLAEIGVKRDSLLVPSLTFDTVALELYDLSDSTRLPRSSAETFPVPPMPTDQRPGCRLWARPSPSDTFP